MGKFKRKSRTTIGCRIDVELWKRFRILAMQKDMDAEKLLDQAIKEFLEKHE